MEKVREYLKKGFSKENGTEAYIYTDGYGYTIGEIVDKKGTEFNWKWFKTFEEALEMWKSDCIDEEEKAEWDALKEIERKKFMEQYEKEIAERKIDNTPYYEMEYKAVGCEVLKRDYLVGIYEYKYKPFKEFKTQEDADKFVKEMNDKYNQEKHFDVAHNPVLADIEFDNSKTINNVIVKEIF